MTAYDVYLGRKNIDTVFYGSKPSGSNRIERQEDVRRSLINHDGYDSDIVVRERREKKIEKNARRGLRRNQTPLERLRYHVSGAIARGEKQGIVGHPKGKIVKVLGHSVRAGSKRYYILMEQKRQFDDLARSENGPFPNRRRGLRRNPLDSMRVYAGRDGFEITDFKKGDRIEMHPATDLWMRGARYGEIIQVGRKNLKVKLDYLRRAIAVSPRNIGQIVARELSTNRRRGLRRNPMNRIEKLRKILSDMQYAKIDGQIVDATTARAILLVYDGLNEQNKARYSSMPIIKMANIAWKMVK
jgi:hypothetical protein